MGSDGELRKAPEDAYWYLERQASKIPEGWHVIGPDPHTPVAGDEQPAEDWFAKDVAEHTWASPSAACTPPSSGSGSGPTGTSPRLPAVSAPCTRRLRSAPRTPPAQAAAPAPT